MNLRKNSRLASHLSAVLIVAMLLLLGWRISLNEDWLPSLGTEPLFEKEQVPSLHGVINQPNEEKVPGISLPSSAEKNVEVVPKVSQAKESASLSESLPRSAPRDTEAESLYESWVRARQLLRQRDLVGAERVYLDLVNRWPRHPDLAGELGNVYVLMGEMDSAKAAFSQAQRLLQPMGPSLQLESVSRWLRHYE